MSGARLYLMAERREPGTGAERIVAVPCSRLAMETIECGAGSPASLMLPVRGPWWLVEADSANAARECIAIAGALEQRSGNPFGPLPATVVGKGRILASGGAK